MLVLLAASINPDFKLAGHALDDIIRHQYAYLDKLPGGALPQSSTLDAELANVTDRTSLLRYAEDRLASLADHHAITGNSFADSWAVVPSYADLWIVESHGVFTIDAVRANSPAAAARISPGDQLVSVDNVQVAAAISAFWHRLGLEVTPRRAAYAARVVAAGRRDRPRQLGIQHPGGAVRTLTLPSLYQDAPPIAPLSVSSTQGQSTIRINNSLGDTASIPAFDHAMSGIPANDSLILDLRNTPSGGNTIVARAILGWFVTRAQSYQIHQRPEEERSTGIAHQWVEQVLPRAGRHRGQMPVILVGR